MSPTRRTHPHIPNTSTCPCGHVLVFPLPLPHFEHQKVPMWARSGARAPPLSLSLVSNTRTTPHGVVLMFGHPSPSRPPERAHMGSFRCSRTSPLPLPRLFTFLVYFYIRIVSLVVFNFI